MYRTAALSGCYSRFFSLLFVAIVFIMNLANVLVLIWNFTHVADNFVLGIFVAASACLLYALLGNIVLNSPSLAPALDENTGLPVEHPKF